LDFGLFSQLQHLRFCAVAGITSDANVLINRLRLTAQQHAYSFSEAMPVEQLVTSICDYKLLDARFSPWVELHFLHATDVRRHKLIRKEGKQFEPAAPWKIVTMVPH